ncbi:MAG: DUF222 domain-containing protein [Acidimicrobiales bacterium]|nr:DUF222 domain-containing protein [Acidimicrobiales bacterium]
MSSSTASPAPAAGPDARLDAAFERLAELQGQRNAIDAEIVDVVAELEADELWKHTGARSLAACVAWKAGSSMANARSLAAIAERREEFPRCVAALAEGQLSADQVGVIAARAPEGSDEHYAQLASAATVAQLQTALKMAPRPKAEPAPQPERFVDRFHDDEYSYLKAKLLHDEGQVFEQALRSHMDALVAAWKRDHGERDEASPEAPPFPTLADAFMRLIELGWDADVAARPHGQRTTVIMHYDVEERMAQFHLGPTLTEAERRYYACDATFEVWFERDGQVIGCGRQSREIPRRLRRALERRQSSCVVPGCGASHGLHAHHLWHWEDGGPTELWNLVLACPYHHRLHHQGLIIIAGPARAPTVRTKDKQVMVGSSLARPPTEPRPDVAPYAGPTGERADWKWYVPPRPPPGGDN